MEHDMLPLPSGYDPWSRDGGCLSRRIFLKGVGIACLGFVPLLQACDSAFSREGKGNERTGAGSAPRAARPLIDLSAPAGTRTATFALG
ncbi:MAG: hypothetical protein ACYC7J_10530 [Syntrophales bacterium]